MAAADEPGESLVAAIARRTEEVVGSLDQLDENGLLAPSELPGWSRLTIACHLRYGATALQRMTSGALAGKAVSYYPHGRDRQRPETLEPEAGEGPQDVVALLREESTALERAWYALGSDDWLLPVIEPKDNPDLGTVGLGRLLVLRLTEVEVHGTDLGLGLGDWSDQFVRMALPMRVAWLNYRRTNHRAFRGDIQGSWLLAATDGPAYRITARGDGVEAAPDTDRSPARATIEATSRDLLALLLGRQMLGPPRLSGDKELGRAFSLAFPGP